MSIFRYLMAAQGPRSDPEYSPRTSLRTLSSIGDQIPAPDAREIDFVLAAKTAAENGATAEEIATLPFFTDAHGFPQARYSPTKIQEWIDIPPMWGGWRPPFLAPVGAAIHGASPAAWAAHSVTAGPIGS